MRRIPQTAPPPNAATALAKLQERLAPRKKGRLDIVSDLHDFALVNYTIPAERLEPHIPPAFSLIKYNIGGRAMGLVSAVPFTDVGFHFRWLPMFRFRFCQTNYRVYVVDRRTSEHVVWFFGTTIGSRLVHPARWLWKIPWHHAKYRTQCDYDDTAQRYTSFIYSARSHYSDVVMKVHDTGEPMAREEGFESLEEQVLTLTHPVTGFYTQTDGEPGTYSVSHPVLRMTRADPEHLYFSLFEKLDLLGKEEMAAPHSIYLCHRTQFHIYMPPHPVDSTKRR